MRCYSAASNVIAAIVVILLVCAVSQSLADDVPNDRRAAENTVSAVSPEPPEAADESKGLAV